MAKMRKVNQQLIGREGIDYADLPTILRLLRKSRGLTQVELAKKAGIERTTLTNIETGSQGISFHILEGIAHALNCELRIQLVEKVNG